MTFSIQEYTGDGTTTDFAITFDYLDSSHVKVAVDDVLTTDGGSIYSFSFVNSTTVRIVKISDGTSAPDVGAAIKVSRQTPITDPPVVWPEGASLTTRDLNKLADYLTYSLQESLDANEGAEIATEAAESASNSSAAAAFSAASASTSASNASASATLAASSAAAAALYAPAYFDDVADLFADTTAWPVGQILNTRAEGFAYQVAASGASDHHVTTAGGVKLYVLADEEGGASVDAFGAVGDGVTDDRAVFIKAEASGLRPIRLSRSYFLSTNTGNTAAVYEIGANATVTMGTDSFQPARLTEEKSKTYQQRVNFASTNPVSGEPTSYSLLDTGYIDHQYLINQWGAQNMVSQASGLRSGAYAQRYQMLHAGEGDGYCTFWSTGVTAHPRIGLATHFAGQSSAGLGGGQTNALSDKVNLYGFGDVVVHDNGFQDVAMYNYVGIVYYNGSNTGDYLVPRLGTFQLNAGSNAIDANFLAGGPTRIAFDATKADVTWGAFAMKSGQSILFDATEAAVDGQFAATAAGNYTLSKPSGVNAFLFTRGADDVHLLRVAGSSASARAAVGSAGTTAYFSAHTTASENTTLSLRTANAGTMGDRVIITSGGNLNVATAGARLQVGGVSVLNARQTGWTAPTGTATRTSFDTATVTTAQLAERVKGLIDDLITHGLIGA